MKTILPSVLNVNYVDWHTHRGLSFLQIGLQTIKALSNQRKPLPTSQALPRINLLPACASLQKQLAFFTRIEFVKVTVF